jgi:hypothetical protein
MRKILLNFLSVHSSTNTVALTIHSQLILLLFYDYVLHYALFLHLVPPRVHCKKRVSDLPGDGKIANLFFTVNLATRPIHPLFWLGFDSRRTSYCDLKWQNLSDLLSSWQNQEGFKNARILRFHSTKAVCFHFRPCGSKTTCYYLTRTMNTVLACCGCPG